MRFRSDRVLVTGLGMVTPVGVGSASYWRAILESRSGARRIESFDADGLPTPFACPVQARRPSGRDVLGAIRDEDGRYLDFPDRGDRAEVWFEAPPLAPESRRTLFARTRGWYEIHLHDLKDPDRDAIARLTAEPGYAVRLAVSEFEEYRRTGVLLGTR